MSFKSPSRPQVGSTIGVTLVLLTVAATLGVGMMAVLQAIRL